MTIGFIGLGVFGGRVATRLVHQGFGLMIFDRVTDAVRYFMLKNSADVAEAPRTLAALCDIVVCVLPSAADVRDATLGPLGLAAGLPDGKSLVLLDLGASSAADARALADEFLPRGVTYIEAPAWGTPLDARDGRLAISCGCDDAGAIEQVQPILRALAGKIVHTGRAGSAHMMGALAEQMRAAAMLAAAEALALGKMAGVAPEAFVAWCEGAGLMAPAVAEILRRNAFNRNAVSSGHTIATVTHNLEMSRAAAAATGVALPHLELLANTWLAAGRRRGAEADHAEIVRWVEEVSAPAPPEPPTTG